MSTLTGFIVFCSTLGLLALIIGCFGVAIEHQRSLTYRERQARKYEKKANRLLSFLVFMSAFPFSFTNAPHRNLTQYVEYYNELAEEWRTGKHG